MDRKQESIDMQLERLEAKLDKLIAYVIPDKKDYSEQSKKAKELVKTGKKPRRQPKKVILCKHCKMDITIRNPSGYCDHLYYPDYCEVCKKMEANTQ